MSNRTLPLEKLRAARERRNRLTNGQKIHNDDQACRFIQERGFVLLMPIDGIPLPNLSEADDAVAWDGFAITDRTWAWKETLPEQKRCAYTKLIHGRGTFIAWWLYPSFLKLYGSDGDPEFEYENGRLERTELELFRIVSEFGPIDSRQLWIKAKPIFHEKRHRFTAVLEHLQSRFLLTVAGGSLEGWSLHTWDLVERQIPLEVLTKCPTAEEARKLILQQTVQNAIAVSERKLRTILRWSHVELRRCIEMLQHEEEIVEVEIEGETVSWIMPREVI